MNRRKFLQILGLAAAAPAAVVRLKALEPRPPRVAPVEIVKTHEKVRTPIGGRIGSADMAGSRVIIWNHDLSGRIAMDVDEAAALVRRAAGGA